MSADIGFSVEVNITDFYDMLEKHDWADKSPIDQSSIDFYNQIMKTAKTSPAHQELFDKYHAYATGELVDGVEKPPKPERPQK